VNSLLISLASAIVFLHLLFILWVIVGAAFTRGRPWLTAVHVASLTWGIIAEIGPWPCPLTLLEQHCETAAGWAAYHGSFLLHYLQAVVYPDFPNGLIVAAGLMVCGINLLVYARRSLRLVRRTAGRV